MPTDISFFSPLNFQRYISVFLNRVQIFQVFLFVLLHFVWGQINPDIFNRLSQYVIHTKSVFSKGILDFLIKCQRIHNTTVTHIDRRYNVSVDVINYTPVTLDELIAQNDVK